MTALDAQPDTSRTLGPAGLHCTGCDNHLTGDLGHLPNVTAAWRAIHDTPACRVVETASLSGAEMDEVGW